MSDAPTPDKPLLEKPRERLGKYELRGVLGKGAMGIVYDGWDPMIQRRVAIKTAHLPDPDDVEAQEELGRFRREAQAAGRLGHPNIVGVYDSGETDGVAYFVMELIEGQSLKQMLARDQRLPPAEIVRVMEEVLAGLHYSHARGVIHRDIKPANVMITDAGTAKIADFGIARIESSSMTQAGTMMGTPAYMSPEQFMGQTVDSRTDIYSAGVMLYQLLTGERPFEGSITAIMHKALNTVPPRPSELSVTVKTAMDAVVARAMARRPEDRFATAADFAAALRAAHLAPDADAGSPALPDEDATMIAPSVRRAPPPAPPVAAAAAKPRSKTPLMAAAAVVVLLAGGGAFFALSGGQAPGTPAPIVKPAPEPQQLAASPDAPKPAPPKPEQAAAQAPPSQPAEPEAKVALVAPPRPPPAAPDAAVVRAAVANAVKDVPCAWAQVATDPDGLRLTGVAGPSGVAALSPAAAGAASGLPVHTQIQLAKPAYCDALNVLRSLADDPAVSLTLKGGGRPLHNGAEIAPVVSLPDAPSYLRLDYLSGNGTVTHLVPANADEAKLLSARTWTRVVGNVGPPYGADMIVALVSSQPLNLGTRPMTEPIGAYFAAVRSAEAAVAARGETVSGAAAVLNTAP